MLKNAIIFVLAALVFFKWTQGCHYKKELNEVTGKYLLRDSAYLAEKQQAKRWRTSDSLNILRVNVLQVDKAALLAYNDGLKGELKKLKIKAGNIVRQSVISTQTSGTITPATDTVFSIDTLLVERDSIINFDYTDTWLHMYGQLKPRFLVNYYFRDSIGVYWHYARDGLFSRKKLRVTVFSHNPRTEITGIKDFEIKEKKKRFFIGLGGGYGWNGTKFSPSVGIIGGFKLFTF